MEKKKFVAFILESLPKTSGPKGGLMMQPKGHKAWSLTRREEQILRLAAEGYEEAEMASRLRIHLKTVRQHPRNLLEKQKIHDLPAAVEHALREGIITAYEILESRYSQKSIRM